MQALTLIATGKISRCFFRTNEDIHDVQLHTFVDASELAYAGVSYLRIHQGNSVYLSLLAAKTKVAPLSPLLIPRINLQAAVTGAKLSQQIQTNSRLSVNSHYYWTDSKTVLKWLRTSPLRLRVSLPCINGLMTRSTFSRNALVGHLYRPRSPNKHRSEAGVFRRYYATGPHRERRKIFRLVEAISSGSNVYIIHRKAESNSAENASDYDNTPPINNNDWLRSSIRVPKRNMFTIQR